MKKLIPLLTFAVLFSFVTFSLAQTTTPTTSTTTKPVKQHKVSRVHTAKKVSTYTKCLNEEMKKLTKEMQTRKKDAWANYQNALKSATSTGAKKEARKAYNQALRDINKWFVQATKEAKNKCKSSTSTPVTFPTTSTSTSEATSTATSTQ
jgi:transketolase